MSVVLYSEIICLCVAILFLLFLSIHKSCDKRNVQQLFSQLLGMEMLLFAVALLAYYVDQNLIRVSLAARWTVHIASCLLSGVSGYFWFLYSESVQNPAISQNKRFRLWSAMPFYVLAFLCLLTIPTGWLFAIDETMQYVQGPLYPMQWVCVYGPMVVTSARAFYKSVRGEDYLNRREYRVLAEFVVLPLVAGTAQIIQPEYPLLYVGITISALNVFINMQNGLISLDPLTKLNNRYQLEGYMSEKITEHSEYCRNDLFLAVMDLDYFKTVNDTYGHVEGDNALVKVANAIKQACHGTSGFIARYGGDEFVILCEADNRELIDGMCDKVHSNLAKVSENLPYTLSVSIGVAQYESGQTAQEFIAVADEELYKLKKSRKREYART